jgi:hypothetical protein
MLRFLEKLVGSKSKPGVKRARPAKGRFKPRGEALETRTLMALIGPELHINTTTSGAQLGADTASQPASFGRTVTAWMHEYSSSDYDIKAQIYDHNGNKVGGEITVANSPRMEGDPSVAVDGYGNFVVTWVDELGNGDIDIRAKRYSSNGAALTGALTVAGSGRAEYEPSVASDDYGNFVVSYTVDASANDRNVLATRFNANGGYITTHYVATGGGNEYDSSAAMTANGRFAVAFQYDLSAAGGGVNSNVYLERYAANGNFLGRLAVAATSTQERNPDIAMDRDGNAVVVYEYQYSQSDWDIHYRKVSHAGAMSARTAVANSSLVEHNPTVAMDHTPGEGDFVVAYQIPVGGMLNFFPNQRTMVREMSAGGAVRATHEVGLQSFFDGAPSIAINGSDNWFVSYAAINRPDDPLGGIYGRRGFLA